MIRHIKGEYLAYSGGAIVVATASGISFRVNVPDTSQILNAKEGSEISVYTHLHVKEDEMSLYGFSDMESLTLFEQLISVNGVGPKAGMAVMSLGSPNRIKSYIVSKDAASISKAQGIGKKTAERIILELSEKVTALPIEGTEGAVQVSSSVPVTGARSEAVLALTTLGYSKSEAETAVSSVTDEELTAEEYIKKSLKYLL